MGKDKLALIGGISGLAVILIVLLVFYAPTKCKRTYEELTTVAKQVSTELNQAPVKYRDEYNWNIGVNALFTWLLPFDKSQEFVNYDGDEAVYICISCAETNPLIFGGKKTWIDGNSIIATEVSNLGLKTEYGDKLTAYIARYYYDGKYYQVSAIWEKDKEKAAKIINKIIGLEIVR